MSRKPRESKVTRVVFSARLNPGKLARLVEQAQRLGVVWRECGSLGGVGVGDRAVRDRWMADGTAAGFGVLANAWKETVRDSVADITANREAAKVAVRRAINRRTTADAERKRLFTALKSDRWMSDPWLSRLMRKYWKRGRNRTHNQIVVRSDQYRTFTLAEGDDVWLAVPGLERRQMVRIPLNSTVAPTGTLRLVLRGCRVEVHYQVAASSIRSSAHPCGEREIGVDKGYTEVLVDSGGAHHGRQLGVLLTSESDHRKVKNSRRAKIRSIAEKATKRGDRAKAARIKRNNLGTIKRERRSSRWQKHVRDVTFKAVHVVVDKASLIAAEDLTKTFTSRTRLGKNTNRRLAAWTKGVTAQALRDVSERRGSALRLVNAAYTSQVIPGTSTLGVRKGDRLHCTQCRAVWHADHAAAINNLLRIGDPDITLRTPYTRVRQILQERQIATVPTAVDPDSSTAPRCVCGERNIPTNDQQ